MKTPNEMTEWNTTEWNSQMKAPNYLNDSRECPNQIFPFDWSDTCSDVPKIECVTF